MKQFRLLLLLLQVFVSSAQAAETQGVIHTSEGDIHFKLFGDKSPIAVTNFTGVATGRIWWTDPRTGKKRENVPLYNGTVFHRVVPGFMIQGGDPSGTGGGNAGWLFINERHPSLQFDRPGLLAMANGGPDTNSCQFFITVAATPFLGDRYTIFGEVTKGMEVAQKIANAPRVPNSEKPVKPVIIKSITF